MHYEVCFVLYEPPIFNGAHTPKMVVTEYLKISFALYGSGNSFDTSNTQAY